MADNSTEAAHPPHAQVVKLPDGTPVVIRTETQVPVTPPKSNDAMFNVTQAGVYLGFLVLLITSIVTCMKWLDGKLEKLGMRVGEEVKEVRSDVKAAEQRILANEKEVVALDKRLSLQEQESRAIKAGQDRIEATLDKMGEDLAHRIDGWADKFEKSIREVREVKPRT